MKIKLSTIVLALFLLIALPLSATATEKEAEAQAPVATAINPSFEFSAVPEGVVVQHEFKLKNSGNAPLEIQKVKTG